MAPTRLTEQTREHTGACDGCGRSSWSEKDHERGGRSGQGGSAAAHHHRNFNTDHTLLYRSVQALNDDGACSGSRVVYWKRA